MLDGMLNRMLTERRIETYEYETCTAENPFDQRLSMQANISRPSDPNCVGLICILGERIGYPLQDFDKSTIPDWDIWSDQNRRYYVVHPWPTEIEEQLKLVKSGGFPLTGTVFEALDALGAGRNIHISYFADRRVTPTDPDVRLNGWNWQTQILQQLNTVEEKTKWLATEYTVQIRGVSNFLNALNERGRDVPVHQTAQQALDRIRKFVETKIVPIRLTLDNPYRFLDFYDIQDSDDFPGRSEESRTTVAELRARASNLGGNPMIARISGESGCGKTSFMRAGILAALNHPRELGRFRVIAVRPTDFHDENGLPDRNLPARLLNIIAREIKDLGLPASALDRVSRSASKAAQFAVEVLEQALAAKGAEAPSIVIGIDQFEEILDDLDAMDRRPYAASWNSLLSFIERAARGRRFGFVYTLESSRQVIFETLKLPKVFYEAYEVRLGGHDDRFLEAIITKPFEKAGYRLSPQIVNDLITSYRSYNDKIQAHASTLPLLSLKLSNLFDTVQNLRASRPRHSSRDGLQAQFDDQQTEVSYEELQADLHFDTEIADLANAAWGNHNKSEDEQIEDLNPVLKPLIALSGNDLDKITLQTVGDTLLVNMDERLSAFEDVRLIIREGGRRRLVHEAVIRQWPLAAKWLERKREYLIDEAQFRFQANLWHAKGADRTLVPSDAASIDIAVAVLRSYIQEWPFCDPADILRSDLNLMNYCQAVLRQSKTPKKTDSRYFRYAHSHVHTAAAYGMTDLVKRFIDEAPDCLELPTDRGTTPIDSAAWSSEVTTRFLIEKGANPVNFNKQGWSTISSSVWRNDRKIFRLLLPYYRTAESVKAPMGTNLLHIAARRGAVDIATTLLATVEGLDPMQKDEYGRTPLHFAAMFDQPEVFNFLLKECDTKYAPEYALDVFHVAAHFGALRVVEEIMRLPQFYDLIEAANSDGMTVLMVAARQRQNAVVRRLLDEVDPNVQVQRNSAKKGWTALHFAIAGPDDKKSETRVSRQQALRTVRALLAAPNIDPTIKARDGMEPTTLARSLPQVRRELITHPKFFLNKRLADGSTPLNYIINEKDRPAVERMLRLTDLDVDLLSADGTYALSLLIKSEMADLALRLFEEGRVDPWNIVGVKDIGLAAAIFADHEPLIEAFLVRLPEVLGYSQRRHLSLGVKAAVIFGKSSALLDRLISLGISPEPRLARNGWTLFHYAAMVGNIEAFDRLAANSTATSRRDEWGRRPADLAPDAVRAEFEVRMTEVADEPFALEESDLVEVEPVPDLAAHEAATSEMLFILARFGNILAITELLAEPQIDPAICDDWGRSPADHAPDAKREEIAQMLRHAASTR